MTSTRDPLPDQGREVHGEDDASGAPQRAPSKPRDAGAERRAQQAEIEDYLRSRYPTIGDPDVILTAFQDYCEAGDDHIDPRSFASISGLEEWGEGLELWCAAWTAALAKAEGESSTTHLQETER